MSFDRAAVEEKGLINMPDCPGKFRQIRESLKLLLEREQRRLHALPCGWGSGRVRFLRRTATLWALLWMPLRWGGLGTNPEYAVKSTDRFLTSLSRIQVEIKDQRNVPVLKFRVRRSPVRPLPPWAKVTLAGLAQACLADGYKAEGNAEDGGNASAPRDTAATAKGSEQTRNVPRNQQIASSPL